jgi:hypothetical protein
MAPSYNGWEDTPEDEREALEQWEVSSRIGRRSSIGVLRPDLSLLADSMRANDL